MPKRKRVITSEELLSQARALYPPGGSVDGTPRLELFERGPLAAAIAYFEREFDEATEAAAGIRFCTTVGHFFRPWPSMRREWRITLRFFPSLWTSGTGMTSLSTPTIEPPKRFRGLGADEQVGGYAADGCDVVGTRGDRPRRGHRTAAVAARADGRVVSSRALLPDRSAPGPSAPQCRTVVSAPPRGVMPGGRPGFTAPGAVDGHPGDRDPASRTKMTVVWFLTLCCRYRRLTGASRGEG